MIGKGKQAQKIMRKLYDMLPSDDFIMTTDSYGPDIMEGLSHQCGHYYCQHFCDGYHGYYYEPFIRTGKDKSKAMFHDFQGRIRKRGMNVCRI